MGSYQKQPITMSSDPLSSEEGVDEVPAKDNFIGKVEFSRVNCECPDCTKGAEGAAKKGLKEEELESDYDHFFHVQPLTEYEKPQNVFGLNTNDNYTSKWMVMIGHLENVHGPLRGHGVENLEDLAEFLSGKVYEFRDITWQEDEEFTWPGTGTTKNLGRMFTGDFTPRSMLVPIREVTDEDELMDLGADEADEVEEVEEISLDEE